jgi:hypothetical protein
MNLIKRFLAWVFLPTMYEKQTISIAPSIVVYLMVGFFAAFIPKELSIWLIILFAFMIAIPASNFLHAICETDKKFLK